MYTINAFEWDDEKARQNALKHGIAFQEAADAFLDPQRLIIEDVSHSELERRQRCMGQLANGRLLAVVFTMRQGESARIISARPANRKERRLYDETQRENRL